MIDKTRNQRQQALKAKRKAEGLERLELWVKPEHKEAIKQKAKELNQGEKNMNTQAAMIQAAQQVEAMMPAKPAKTLMGNRTEQLVYSVFEQAAKAAYLRAAQECLNAAHDAAQGGIDLAATHEMITDKSVSLSQLKEMCTTGYAWGGNVVTL